MSGTLRMGRMMRWMTVGLMLVLALGLLAACGGSSPGTGNTPPAIGPEQRVKNFADDLGAAFSDPDLSKPEKQEEHSAKLAAYFKPADQAKAKEEMLDGMSDFAKSMAEGMGSFNAMMSGMDIRMTMKPDNVTTKLVEETDTTAKVEVVSGSFKIGFEGKDAANVPAEVSALTSGQALPLSDLLSDMQIAEANVITLEKVDGTWYFPTPEE